MDTPPLKPESLAAQALGWVDEKTRAISPPKRPSNAACRYSGSASWYLALMTQASAFSVNNPLGTSLAGAGAVRTVPLQHGHAYFTRSWRMTRTCSGTMSSCSLASTPISLSALPSCGHTRSPSGSS